MKSKRSRLALLGLLALVLSVTVGLVSGSVADAKKKKKKSANFVTVSKTTPTTIPGMPAPTGNETLTTIPLMVGKKAKGKAVSFDSVDVTTTFSAPDNSTLDDLAAEISSPNGRTTFLNAP